MSLSDLLHTLVDSANFFTQEARRVAHETVNEFDKELTRWRESFGAGDAGGSVVSPVETAPTQSTTETGPSVETTPVLTSPPAETTTTVDSSPLASSEVSPTAQGDETPPVVEPVETSGSPAPTGGENA